MKKYFVLAALLFAMPAMAGKDKCLDPKPSDHVRFECLAGLELNGADGAQGAQGEQGETGETGESGQTGATGATGQTGTQGSTGAAGARGASGAQGETGATGDTGATGASGERGAQGANGTQGIPGVAGRDGVVSDAWINETRRWQSEWVNYSAASDAIQVHLPQDKESRVTIGASRLYGRTGYALGYAYKNENSFAFTLALGRAGTQEVVKASIGWEF